LCGMKILKQAKAFHKVKKLKIIERKRVRKTKSKMVIVKMPKFTLSFLDF